jgi:uncharacterized membrane protein YgcG
MKMELVVGLLIYLVTVTLANVVPAVDQKFTVGAVAIEPVESAESIESLENNDPKVSIVDVAKESVSLTETVEPVESAESTESSVDNDVLKTSETFHRRYYYYPRTYYYPRYHYPQYYRRPVTSGYYNRYPQQPHNANRYSYNRPSSSPAYYTQPTTPSYAQYSYVSGSSSYGGGDIDLGGGGDAGGVGGGDGGSYGGCRRKRGSRSKRCGVP